jgi:hypothetical protein
MSQESCGASGWQGPCLRLRGWLARYVCPSYDQARFIQSRQARHQETGRRRAGTALAAWDDWAFAAAVHLRYPPGLTSYEGWDIRGRWFGVVVVATPRLGKLPRGETILWRGVGRQIASSALMLNCSVRRTA